MADLLAIEFHDGDYARLELDERFDVHVIFSIVICYYSTADPSVTELWTCPAELHVQNPTSLSVTSPVHEARHVSDCELTALPGESIDPHNLSLLAGQPVAELRILMEGDAVIATTGGVARVSIGERILRLECVPWPF